MLENCLQNKFKAARHGCYVPRNLAKRLEDGLNLTKIDDLK